VTEHSLSAETERALERQANLFASHLAAPAWLVNYAMHKTFRPAGPFVFREPCIYYLDVQDVRVRKYIVDAGDLCGWIGSKTSGYLGGLSAEEIGYRIASLGWARDLCEPDLPLYRTARGVSVSATAPAPARERISDGDITDWAFRSFAQTALALDRPGPGGSGGPERRRTREGDGRHPRSPLRRRPWAQPAMQQFMRVDPR
jgi:hypothetical protein